MDAESYIVVAVGSIPPPQHSLY